MLSAQTEEDALTLFRAAHRSKYTLDHNQRFLRYFLDDFLGNISPQDFVEKSRKEPRWSEAKIASYFMQVSERVRRKEIRPDSALNYEKPIKILLDMNDVELNWRRLKRVLPASRRNPFRGSAPAKETIKSLCSYPDRRIKPIILAMTSGGLRLGAWDWISVQDLTPCMLDKKLVCGKLTVYRDEPEEYSTRISLEAYNAFQEYISFRKENGEHVTETSPLVRDLWAGDRGGKGEIHLAKRLAGNGIKKLLTNAWSANSTLRTKPAGKKRFDVKTTHFARKFFETACLKAGIEPWQIKIFRGDVLPTDLGYEGFTEEELTKLYLKASSELCIFGDGISLDQVEILKTKLQKAEDKFERLKESDELFFAELDRIKESQKKDMDEIRKKLGIRD